MTTDTSTLLHALRALEPAPRKAKPVYGLDDIEDEYTFPAEQFGLTFRTYFLRDPILVDRITLERRGQSVDLPLCMFDGCHLDDIADEITAALRERSEERALARGDYELERSRDLELLRGEK